MTKQFIAIKRK